MLEPDRKLGPYVVEALIAEGATARVYRVRHEASGTLHALKHLPLLGAEARDALVREAAVLGELRHPHIVAVDAVLDVDGDPALVMPLVDGPTLEDHLLDGALPLDEAESLFVAICGAMAFAHARGVVHLDLKPANVLLERTSAGLVPRITDFGVAAALGSVDGGGMGTPAYSAPERIREGSRVDGRADVFSLGCLLYELVTGRRAFTGTDALVVLDEVVSVRYTPPDKLRPELPERIVATISCCLQSDPSKRAHSVDAVLGVLSGETDPASATATSRLGAPLGLGDRGPLVAAGLFAAALLAVAFYYLRG